MPAAAIAAAGVVLGGEDVAGGQRTSGPGLLRRFDQNGRLNRHVEAAGRSGLPSAVVRLPYFPAQGH